MTDAIITTGLPAAFICQCQNYADQPKAAFSRADFDALDHRHVVDLAHKAKTIGGFKRMISRAIAAAKTGIGTTGSERLEMRQFVKPIFTAPVVAKKAPVDWEARRLARDYCQLTGHPYTPEQA